MARSFALTFVCSFALACGSQQAAPQSEKAPPAAAPSAQNQPAAAQAPASPSALPQAATPNAPATTPSKIANIVVLEKQECCECTKTRQEKSWEALQQAIKTGGFAPTVVKVYTDTQAEEAELYKAMRPTMVTPALYFFDAQQNLIDMLQGELAAEAITKVLSGT